MSGTSLAVVASRCNATVLPDKDKVWTNRLQIKSSSAGRFYTVAQKRTDGSWACSCMGWLRHRHCKHLSAMLPVLQASFPTGTSSTQTPTQTNSPPVTGPTFILLDTSGSMVSKVGKRRRIDILAEVFTRILPEFPTCRLVAFGTGVWELQRGKGLPEPGGTTPLHSALAFIAPHKPGRVVVLCDGEPDNAKQSLATAKSLHCTIATYFCGDENNAKAVAFMRSLAELSVNVSGGEAPKAAIVNLNKPQALVDSFRLLLK